MGYIWPAASETESPLSALRTPQHAPRSLKALPTTRPLFTVDIALSITREMNPIHAPYWCSENQRFALADSVGGTDREGDRAATDFCLVLPAADAWAFSLSILRAIMAP